MSDITIRYSGHTTVLIHTKDVNLVIDPNFSRKLFTLKRLDKPQIDFEILHKVNAILITNPHHNRLNTPSFKYFKQTAQMIVPWGLGKLVNTFFNFRLTELKAGAQTMIGDWKVIGVKSLHRGFRKCRLFSRNSLNYILKYNGKTIFYCSDTPYDGAYFFDVAKEHKIDLAILPVDHVGPDFMARKRFMTVEQAIQACQDLGASKLLPSAFGSFNFSGRKAELIKEKILKEIEKHELQERLCLLTPSETYTL